MKYHDERRERRVILGLVFAGLVAVGCDAKEAVAVASSSGASSPPSEFCSDTCGKARDAGCPTDCTDLCTRTLAGEVTACDALARAMFACAAASGSACSSPLPCADTVAELNRCEAEHRPSPDAGDEEAVTLCATLCEAQRDAGCAPPACESECRRAWGAADRCRDPMRAVMRCELIHPIACSPKTGKASSVPCPEENAALTACASGGPS